MKVNNVIEKLATIADKLPQRKAPKLVEAQPEEPEQSASASHGLIFQPSEQMKNMLTLIARDNPKLYNRIVGME